VLTSSTSMYIVHIVPSTLYIVHCTLYIVHCTLYIVQYLQYNGNQICHRHGNSSGEMPRSSLFKILENSSLDTLRNIISSSEILLRQTDDASLVSLTYDEATTNLPNLFSYKSQYHNQSSYLYLKRIKTAQTSNM
jgi:hypothetical protein